MQSPGFVSSEHNSIDLVNSEPAILTQAATTVRGESMYVWVLLDIFILLSDSLNAYGQGAQIQPPQEVPPKKPRNGQCLAAGGLCKPVSVSRAWAQGCPRPCLDRRIIKPYGNCNNNSSNSNKNISNDIKSNNSITPQKLEFICLQGRVFHAAERSCALPSDLYPFAAFYPHRGCIQEEATFPSFAFHCSGLAKTYGSMKVDDKTYQKFWWFKKGSKWPTGSWASKVNVGCHPTSNHVLVLTMEVKDESARVSQSKSTT